MTTKPIKYLTISNLLLHKVSVRHGLVVRTLSFYYKQTEFESRRVGN